MKAVFLDRDGTVTVGTPTYERVDSLDKVQLLPHTLEALELLTTLDYSVFFVTNQAGLAEGLITPAEFDAINNKVLELIAPSGIRIVETYLCPHAEQDNCDCRKPKPKMLLDAAHKYDINLGASFTVGDRTSDVETGHNAGTRTILVQTGAILDAPGANFVATDLLEAVQYIKLQTS